jgi:hypothetical protein
MVINSGGIGVLAIFWQRIQVHGLSWAQVHTSIGDSVCPLSHEYLEGSGYGDDHHLMRWLLPRWTSSFKYIPTGIPKAVQYSLS